MGGLASIGLSEPSSGGSGLASLMGSKPEGSHSPSILSRIGQIVTGVPGGLMQLGSDVARLPLVGVQSLKEGDFGQRFPAIFGMGQGALQTAHHLNPMELGDTVQDYKDDPVGALFNDAANLSVVAAPAAKALGAGAAAGTARATIAGRLEQMGGAAGKVADIPTAAWRFPLTKATEAVGARAAAAVDAGSQSAIAQGLVRFGPNAKALNNVLQAGTAEERATIGALSATERQTELAGILRSDIHGRTVEAASKLPFVEQVPLEDGAPAVRSGRAGVSMDELGRRDREAVFGEKKGGATLFRPEEPWLPNLREGTFRSLGEASGGRFKGELAETSVLPESLAREVERHFRDPNEMPLAKGLGEAMSPLNRAHRILRMDLSPGWALGQYPGNALMLASHSSTPLADLGRYVRNIKTGKLTGDAQVTRTGTQMAAEEAAAHAKPGRINSALTKAEDVAQKTHLAEVADRSDNAARSAFYEGRIAEGHSPDVAREMTLRALGDFGRKSAGERAYVQPLVPFYGWSREVLKMTAHLAEDHPVRAAVMANLGRIQQDAEGEDRPGKRKVDGSFLVPYGQSGDSFKGTLFGMGKKLGPAPKLAALLGTGKSMSTGKDLNVGQAYGEDNTPGIHNLRPALKSIAAGYPIKRAAQPESRYQTRGEAVFSFLSGVDVEHSPTEQRLAQEKRDRARRNQEAKIRRLTREAKG